MGIILGNEKLIFDELIQTASFDDFFKNSIRDYYTYGFKSYNQFNKGRQRIDQYWKILDKVFGNQWEFCRGKNGRNQIVLKTMIQEAGNLMDDLYFLHSMGNVGDYLQYLMDLDVCSYLRDVHSYLKRDNKELIEVIKTLNGEGGKNLLENTNEVEYAIIQNWIKQIEEEPDKDDPEFRVRLSKQLCILTESTRQKASENDDKNFNYRVKPLKAYGVLGNLKDIPEQRNKWLCREWEKYLGKFRTGSMRTFKSTRSHINYWYKSQLKMRDLVNAETESYESEFLDIFLRLCEFFSAYYPLGEVGTILLNRCKVRSSTQSSNCFRIKHNYIQKSLYDYNLSDILMAIETGGICLFQYCHGINLSFCEVMVIPLEVRVSVSNGREYVMCYDVEERKIKALRLEFIDKIIIYSKVKSVDKIKRINRRNQNNKKKHDKEIRKLVEICINNDELNHQIDTAKKMLPYIWGTEIGSCTVDDNWEERLTRYELAITYSEESESYIKDRVERENRRFYEKGSVSNLTLKCFPTKEIRNWARSFYMRVCGVSGTDGFDFEKDVDDMWKLYFWNMDMPGNDDKEIGKKDAAESVEFGYKIKGKSLPEEEMGHAALFNELFSRYTIVLANAILKCSSKEPSDFKSEIKSIARKSFDYYSQEEIDYIVQALKAEAKVRELIDDKGRTRFIIENQDYLFDLLPLTKVEARWLMTVLEDPLAGVFLNRDDIEKLKNFLREKAPYEVKPLPFDRINYFDRYTVKAAQNQFVNIGESITLHPQRVTSKKEKNLLRKLYHAMNSGEKVRIKFRNWKGEEKYVVCAPAWIEYSRRDDVFRVWYVRHGEENEIRKINVSRIVFVNSLSGEKYQYNLWDEQKLAEEILEHTMTELTVEFYQGKKNLPDRILTEFSMWKKRCVYDTTDRKYRMTLYYSTMDEKELLVRLLSYGPYIKIIRPENRNYVYEELTARVDQQQEIIRNRNLERS